MNISEFEKIKPVRKVEEKEQPKSSALRNTSFGVVNSIPQTLLSIPTLIEGVGRAALGAGQAVFDDDLTLKEGLLKGITDNKSLQAMDYVDTKLRDVFNVPDYEDADKAQQIEEFSGEMLPVIATGGSYGLINLGRKAAIKAARKAAKKAAVKQLGQEAKKQAIKKAVNRTNLGLALITPGVQITKNAPKIQKGVELGAQVGLPLTLNEISKASSDKPGILFDYSPAENEENIQTLELKSRKNAAKNKINYMDVNLNEPVESFDDKVKDYIKTGAKIAAPIAVLGVFRNTKYAKKLVQQIKNAKTARQNAITFSDTLNPNEKILNTIDTKNIVDNALQKGFITDQKVANSLYRNTYQQAINSFDTGTLYIGDKLIQTNHAPRWVVRDIQALKVSNPKEYKQFSTFMNDVRILQNKVYEYNAQNVINLTISDVLNDPELSRSLTSINDETFASTYRKASKLYDNLQKNGAFKKVLSDISDIEEKLLKIAGQTGETTPNFNKNLKENKTIFNSILHLPGLIEPELTGIDKIIAKLTRSVKNSEMYKNASPFAFGKRSETSTYLNVLPFEDSFEFYYKNTIKRLLNNQNSRLLTQDLMNTQRNKIKSILNNIEELQGSINDDNYREILSQISKNVDNIVDSFNNIKYLGEIDTDTGKFSVNSNPLFHILNKSVNESTQLERSINAKINNIEPQHLLQAIQDAQNKAKYIVVPEDNKLKLYQVDDWLGQIVQQDPQNAGIIYQTIRGMSSFVKSFITGKYNPLFSPITGAYTTTDQLLGLKGINKYLDMNISKADVAKNYINSNATEPFKYKYHANELNKLYTGLERGKINRTPEVYNQISQHENAIRNSNINQIRATGANLQGRYPVNVYKQKAANIDEGFIVNSSSTLSKLKNLIKNSKLVDNNVVQSAEDGLKYIGYTLNSFRDVPTLGLYKAYSKTFLKNGKIDADKIMQVSRAIDRVTATGALTPAQNKAGKVVQEFNDIFLYFSDMLSENIARGRLMNFGAVSKHLVNLIDNDVKLSTELKNIAKGITGNDFVKAGVSLIAVPTILSSMWNHATIENEEAYDALPDNYKTKGIVFANVINGKPVVIPLTQSLMWLVTILRSGVADPLLRKAENKYNPSNSFMYDLQKTADINWGVSIPPVAGLAINAMGYRSPQLTDLVGNMFNKDFALDNMQLRNINYNGNTYYENGVFGPKSRAMIQTLFGNPGNAIAEMVDVTANTGSLSQGLEAGANKYLTTGINMFNPKASTWSATSADLYNKEQDFKRATRNTNLTPEQQNVLLIIKQYHNTYLNKTIQEVKGIRKQIIELRNTGKTSDGKNISYNNAQEKINDLTKQIKMLQSKQIKQYEILDKLLKQHFNTTYTEFMEGIK